MKLVKSLLLGSAALVTAAAGAQAADLPFRKAAPVDYVRVCDWTGTGFFYIPGTDTCLKIGGYIYGEYDYVTGGRALTPTPVVGGSARSANYVVTPSRSKAQSGFFLRGNINMDARTQTAYGTLRTFISVRLDRFTGNYAANTLGSSNFNTTHGTSNVYLYKGFIEFAGITAGRVQSFFDFFADNYNFEGIANSDADTQVLAYTAQFGGGFSATLSMEDRDSRNVGIGNIAFGNTGMIGSGATYAGQTIPDFVGSLNVDQAWGRAQLSAAFHDVNTVDPITGQPVPGGPAGSIGKTTQGFALNAGLMIKLPMLAAGDELWLEGGYMNGAISYQEEAGGLNNGFYGQFLSGFQHVDQDAVAVRNPNGTGAYNLYTPTGFHVLAGLKHYWTPQFHTFTFGSYEEIGYGNVVKHIDWTRGGIGDASEFRVGNDFIFTPVANFDIGLEVMYARLDQTLAHEIGAAPTALPAGIKKNPDAFTTRLKLERDF